MQINFETVSFTVSIASIILAILSLLFSVIFFRWSEKSNKQTYELSKGIEGNTKKIEDLFDKFYSDTFGLMKSNYEAMQSNIFSRTLSSGDSSFTEGEQVETIIISIILKCKVSTTDSICHFIETVHPTKNLSREEIVKAIDSLHKKNLIYKNQDMLSIAPNSSIKSDGGGEKNDDN